MVTATQESAGATLEPTGTPTATAAPAAEPVKYQVKRGDTLQVIANNYDVTVQAIIDANGLAANGFIRQGQELLIPGPNQPATAAPTPTPTGGTLIYRVAAGDTIASIAARYGSSIEWVLNANNLKENDFLQIGQSLMVPLSNVTPEPTATGTPSPDTPTPTSGPSFGAPVPLSPAEGETVTGETEILLTWTSVGVLAEDQWYMVTLTSTNGSPVAPYWTKSTSWRLTEEYREARALDRARPHKVLPRPHRMLPRPHKRRF